MDIWLHSYDKFVNVKNNIKQRNLNIVFANISSQKQHGRHPTTSFWSCHIYKSTNLINNWTNMLVHQFHKRSTIIILSHPENNRHYWSRPRIRHKTHHLCVNLGVPFERSFWMRLSSRTCAGVMVVYLQVRQSIVAVGYQHILSP